MDRQYERDGFLRLGYCGRGCFHPHIHCVNPGGELSPDHTRWIHSRDAFFFADPSSQQSVPREVCRCTEAGASPRPIDLCRIDPTYGRPQVLRCFSPNIVPSGLGRLCQAGIRWSRAGSSLLGTIHTPHCHLESPTGFVRRHPRDVSMERLCSG